MTFLSPQRGKQTQTAARRRQRGSLFAALFGAVAMTGVLALGVNAVMKGPIAAMGEVSRKTIAENNMVASARLAIVMSTSQPSGGDCDADGYIEPLPYRNAAAGPKPAGGGYLPNTIGAGMIDPWQTEYGYCVWDHGGKTPADNVAACGGSSAKRLKGAPKATQIAIAVVSAGKDKTFQTTCNAFVDANADGTPDTPLLNKPAGSDDLVLGYTYAEAGKIGGGLWNIKSGDPGTAEIGARDIEIKGSNGATAARIGYDAGLGVSGVGDFSAVKSDQVFSKSGTAPVNLNGILRAQGVTGLPSPGEGGGGADCASGPVGTVCPDGAIYIGELYSTRLYVAPADQGSTYAWGPGNTATGARDELDGQKNTNWLKAQTDVSHDAAKACSTKAPAGTWYLPAINELWALVNNSTRGGGVIDLSAIGIQDDFYWSSTGTEYADAVAMEFANNSNFAYIRKSQHYYVRCFRTDTSGGGGGGGGGGTASCTPPWGGSITHGNGTYAYSAQNAPNCSAVSYYRTCYNGALQGGSTYQYQNCTSTGGTWPHDFVTVVTNSGQEWIQSETVTISGLPAGTHTLNVKGGTANASVNGTSLTLSGGSYWANFLFKRPFAYARKRDCKHPYRYFKWRNKNMGYKNKELRPE